MATPAKRNLRRWLLTAAAGEEIVAVTTAEGDRLPWRDAASALDSDLVLDWNLTPPAPLYAWTRSRVIFVDQYDGWPRLRWLPRHPSTDCPELGGADTE